MWPLWKLLFSRNYWNQVLRGHTWSATWRALRRAHKDGRAWRQLARMLFLLLLPFSIPMILVALAPGGIVLVWVYIAFMVMLSRQGFGVKAKSGGLNIVDIEAELHRTPEVRRFLGELCLLHAVLVERAGSERFLRTKTLPEGVEIITRRKHIDLLREHGLYDRLGALERDLILLPDGHWPEEILGEVDLAVEPVRLLRWVLRLDSFLPTIGETMRFDRGLIESTLQEPERVLNGEEWVAISALDIGVNAATDFWYRAWSEGFARGFFVANSPEQELELREIAERFKGKESKDLLLDGTIMSGATEGDVRLAGLLGWRRRHILLWIRARVMGQQPVPGELALFYPPEMPVTEDLETLV
jgi:hypothetical protein